MKRTQLKRGTGLSRSTLVKPINRARKASEFQRAYHSKARVAWVKAQPCAVLLCNHAPCENAHIESGGMGRKADADKIIPLCRDHHWQAHNYGWNVLPGLSTEQLREHLAAQTQARWEQYAESE